MIEAKKNFFPFFAVCMEKYSKKIEAPKFYTGVFRGDCEGI